MGSQKEREMKKYRYIIIIEEPSWEGYKYALQIDKKFGDCHGHWTHTKTKVDALKEIREMIESWEGYDSILGRNGDKVTMKNTFFQSFTPDITAHEAIFGTARLEAFF